MPHDVEHGAEGAFGSYELHLFAIIERRVVLEMIQRGQIVGVEAKQRTRRLGALMGRHGGPAGLVPG